MRINRLHVQNFRCVEAEDFEFSPSFNLLVGVNGSGKTTLLKAIAAVMATPINGTRRGTVWLHEKEQSVRLALVQMKGRIRFERSYPVCIEAEGELCGKSRKWWVSKDGPASQPRFEHTIYSAIADEAAKIVQSGEGALPVAAFYSSERRWSLTGASPEQAATSQDSRFDAYVSWHDAALDMKGLETWIIAKSLERLEAASNAYNGPVPADDELSLVNIAVARAMDGAQGLRYDIKHRRLLLDWRQGDPTPFETLSDGQRAMCSLVADIARRMCLLNPHLGAEVLRETPGIVLIDELDMHLHPEWQRRITHALKETFPKVQFFAASHSPQILGELHPDEIILLHPDGFAQPQASYGLDSSRVLQEIMGASARTPAIEQALDDIFFTIERGDLTKAREQLTALKELAPGIAEIDGAEALLKRKEVLGR